MSYIGTYDGTIFYNPSNKYCVISVKTADQNIPLQARSARQYKDHLIRFVAVGYELPRTDAVQIEMDGEWQTVSTATSSRRSNGAKSFPVPWME